MFSPYMVSEWAEAAVAPMFPSAVYDGFLNCGLWRSLIHQNFAFIDSYSRNYSPPDKQSKRSGFFDSENNGHADFDALTGADISVQRSSAFLEWIRGS